MQAERPSISRELAIALAACLAAGALVGVGVGHAAARMNVSLRAPGDAVTFAAELSALYALLLAPLAAPALVARRLAAQRARRVRRAAGWELFTVHLLAAWAAFGGYALVRGIVGRTTWRPETDAWSLAAGLVGAGVGAALALALLSGGRWADRLRKAAWKPAAILAAAYFAGLATLARPSGPAPGQAADAERAAPTATAPPGSGRILLLAIDGADWRRIDRLAAGGELPAFRRLIETGARAPLRSSIPTWSPILWSTVATGVPPEVHGVRDFTELEVPFLERGLQRARPKQGRSPHLPDGVGLIPLMECLAKGFAGIEAPIDEVPVTSVQRRAPAIWNILSARGVRTGVVRWFATWPAETGSGIIVADNDPWLQLYAASKTLDLHETLLGLTQPPELTLELAHAFQEARRTFEDPAELAAETLAHPVLAGLDGEARAELAAELSRLETARAITGGDAFAAAAARHLLEQGSVDFLAVYLRAIDNISHRFHGHPAAIDGVYRWTDALVAGILERAGEGATVLLVSDHGWDYGEPLGHDHAPPGILLAAGPAIVPGAQLAAAPHLLDVAPTLLALHGLPKALDMPGRALLELLRPELRARVPDDAPESYGPYAPRLEGLAGGRDSPGRREQVRLLQALGYAE